MLSGVLTASLDVQYLRVVGSAVVVEEWTVLLLILSPQHKHTVAHATTLSGGMERREGVGE